MRLAIALVLAVASAGCAREPRPEASSRHQPSALPVEVFADSGQGGGLPPAPMGPEPGREAARLTLVDVAPARGDLAIAMPEAEPGAPPESPRSLEESSAEPDSLQPPIARGPARLVLPARSRRGDAVELDVRVDEQGLVSDALWVGGSRDSALVAAATDAALGMRFFPALRRGRPVAVWCRQRVIIDR